MSRWIVALGLVVALASACRAQWGMPPELRQNDLVAVGNLVRAERRVVRRGTALYEELTGTIRIERILYAHESVGEPSTVQLYSAQLRELLCPRVAPEAYLLRRGIWCLDRTTVAGVFTAYQAEPWHPVDDVVVAPATAIELGRALVDRATATLDLEVRYENPSNAAARFDRVSLDGEGRLRAGPNEVLGVSVGWNGVPRTFDRSSEEAGSVLVAPKSCHSETIRLPLLCTEAEADHLMVGFARGLKLRGVQGCRPAGSPSPWSAPTDAPIFLMPGEPLTVVFAQPGPAALGVAALVGSGLLVVSLARPRARRFGVVGLTVATAALAVLPWCAAGFMIFDVFLHPRLGLVATIFDVVVIVAAVRVARPLGVELLVASVALASVAVVLGGPLVGH